MQERKCSLEGWDGSGSSRPYSSFNVVSCPPARIAHAQAGARGGYQWRSSSSSTDISITTFDFKEGQLTLLTHALHRAPSASSDTWSGGCSLLFERAAGGRECLKVASTIINNDIAREACAARVLCSHGAERYSEVLSAVAIT